MSTLNYAFQKEEYKSIIIEKKKKILNVFKILINVQLPISQSLT